MKTVLIAAALLASGCDRPVISDEQVNLMACDCFRDGGRPKVWYASAGQFGPDLSKPISVTCVMGDE